MEFASAFDLHGVTEDERATFSPAQELPSKEGKLGIFPPRRRRWGSPLQSINNPEERRGLMPVSGRGSISPTLRCSPVIRRVS